MQEQQSKEHLYADIAERDREATYALPHIDREPYEQPRTGAREGIYADAQVSKKQQEV